MNLVFQYFADRDVFCAGRVPEEDLQRVASATGASVQTSVNNIVPEVRPVKILLTARNVNCHIDVLFDACTYRFLVNVKFLRRGRWEMNALISLMVAHLVRQLQLFYVVEQIR